MLDMGPAKMALPNLADLEREEEEERQQEAGQKIEGMPRSSSVPPNNEDEGAFENNAEENPDSGDL